MIVQWFSEIIGTTTKNDVKLLKTMLMVMLKKISLYILRILGLMSLVTIITRMAKLVPSPRCSFGFEDAFQL